MVLFKRVKTFACPSIQSTCNEEALAWRVFPSFQPQHNTVDKVDADENTKIKFSHKEKMIYTTVFCGLSLQLPLNIFHQNEYFARENSLSLVVRCLKFIHHLRGYFVSLWKCCFFYFSWRLNMESVFSFWLFFQVLLILIVLFCFSVEFLPQITTLLTDLGASQAEVSWK